MKNKENFDFTIFGGGIFGLYAANLLGRKGLKVCVVESNEYVFGRASSINQTRVHQGYHYPRSLATAKLSTKYFNRFVRDFEPAINRSFKQIYSISNRNSYTSNRQFLKFCGFCDIPARKINHSRYFNPGTVEGAYETEEFSFDPNLVKEILLERNRDNRNITYKFKEQLIDVKNESAYFFLNFASGLQIKSQGVLNCSYASVNQILALFQFDLFDLKYEICEVALCSVSTNLKEVGITMMDGPFFSIMPYGKTALHTLTAVEHTPRKTSMNQLPQFPCQKLNTTCTPNLLQNCNQCPAKPHTVFKDMCQMAKKYLKPEFQIFYKRSLFAIKPILVLSEMDDSRPTIIQTHSENPKFISVLSGKINAIYELEKVANEI